MPFSFRQPHILLLIPAAAAFSIYMLGKRTGFGNARKKTILTLRIAVTTLLVLAMAGTGIKHISDSATTVFVVDGSDSMEQSREQAEEFIRKALNGKKPQDKAGVVQFGLNAEVEVTPSRDPIFHSLQTKINGSFTNIEKGIELASSLLPSGDRKRVVLVTDGVETAGDALKLAGILGQRDITVDVYPLQKPVQSEVMLTDVKAPQNLHLNESYEVIASVYSTVRTDAVIRLYTGRNLSAERKVRLEPGTSRFSFSCIAENGGMVTHRVDVDSINDTIPQNNSMSLFSYVRDVPKVLIVHGDNRDGSELAGMLADNLDIDERTADSVPVSLTEMQKYDAFILANVAAYNLNPGFLENLETVVRMQGKGLLVTGGEESYAPGGYSGTALEKMLPVNMHLQSEEEDPTLGIILVIDKSGSMSSGSYGLSKIALAKEAAIRSCEVLSADDMIGVIAFDSAVKWVVELQNASDKEAIKNRIGTIMAGGGTQILPALRQAYLALKDADTVLKHIILLTDGQAEKEGYEPLMEGIVEAGITLSTVAVGTSSDLELLSALAWFGQGRFYVTTEFTDIPKIFAKETFMAGRKYLNNRTFAPVLAEYSGILHGIEAVPFLDGYVAVSAKNTAKVVLTTDTGEPVLATWQYGLGNTVAWTSDMKGMWSSSWLKWDNNPRFWNNIVSWILQYRQEEDYIFEGRLENGRGLLTLQLPLEDGFQGEVEVTIKGPGGEEEKIGMIAEKPGLYNGTFDAGSPGVYIATAEMKGNDGSVRTLGSGVCIPYSPEYDIRRYTDGSLIAKLASIGGGRIISSPEDVFSGELKEVSGITDITSPLLLMAAILFLLEIIIKRINIPVEKILVFMRYIVKMPLKGISVLSGLIRRYIPGYAGKYTSKHTGEYAGPGKPESTAVGREIGKSEKEPAVKNTAGGAKDDAKNTAGITKGTPNSGEEKSGSISALLEKKRRNWNS